MSFLAPLGFLFAAALPAIVAMYLLKLRRTRRVVPSTLLWRRAAEDSTANAPFQKLRRNLLLLLQLLIAALVVAALARPVWMAAGAGARSVVIAIDNSASMGAIDSPSGITVGIAGNRTRLAEAKALAAARVRAMPPGAQAMVLSFADKPRVAAQFTADRDRLLRAIDAIPPTDLPTRAADALALAQSLARAPKAEVTVFSDGAFDPAGLTLAKDVPVNFIPVGSPAASANANVAVTALDVRRNPERPAEFQVFATVRNHRDTPAEVKLEVKSNGKLADVRPLTVPARGTAGQVFPGARLAEGPVELRLAGWTDPLPADDAAYAVIRPPRARRVLLVGAGNYFLERALRRAPGARYEVERMSTATWTPAAAKADVTVFDGACPAAALPPGAYLFVNCRPPLPGAAENGVDDNPALFDQDTRHPVMRFVELGDVAFGRVRKLTLPPASTVLAETRAGNPLLATAAAGGVEAVVWNFDLFATNLPLRVAFPILASNSLDWLLRKAPGAEAASATTGQTLAIDAPADARSPALTDPDGRTWALAPDPTGRIAFDRTARAGFYTADFGAGRTQTFGVALTDEAESDITPRRELPLATGGAIAAAPAGAAGTPGAATTKSPREAWRYVTLAALAILCAEWYVFHRRVLV